MKPKLVKDLMVPLSDYATVSEDATLIEAVAALKASQEAFSQSRYRHRSILILNAADKVVGQVSLLSILRGLEPKYDRMLSDQGAMHVSFTKEFQKSMIEQLKLWEEPLEHICMKVAKIKVKTFMTQPGQSAQVMAGDTLDQAIHQFVIGGHQSLMVFSGEDVVGILRLTDMYECVAKAVSQCES